MKTREELNAIKQEVEALSSKLGELNDEELQSILGGQNLDGISLEKELKDDLRDHTNCSCYIYNKYDKFFKELEDPMEDRMKIIYPRG